MRQVFKGDLNPEQNYNPGDIVRDRGRGFRVRSHRGEWLPVAAPPDPSCAGPPGRDGRDGVSGNDGAPGAAGAPGAPGISWRGPWKRGRVYEINDAVSLLGESWIAVASTNMKPGVGKGFERLCERGQDGADGRDGRDGESFTSIKFRREIVQGPQLAMTAASDFVAGDAAYATAAGLADLACADGEPQTLAVGVAIAPATAGWPVQLATSGLVTCANWSWSTPGAPLYLSPTTPGGLTEVYPTEVGKFVVVMGTVISPTQISLNINWKEFIGA